MSESNNNFGIGRGITITTGFDVAARLPLDARTVVNTKDDLSAIPDAVKYEGLLVFVVEENKLYQWKQELLTSGEFADEYSWGPIESEISARNVEDFSTLDFINTKSLHMQKNKVDFFPITHERFVFNDNGESLYETNAKLDEAIADFQNRVDQAIKDWNEQVSDMQAKTEADLNSMKQELEAEIDALLKELNDKSNEMDETFAEKIEEINKQIAELQAKIEADVDAMLKDVDNSILSDIQIDDLLRQINENLALLEEDGSGSGSIIATSFETYATTVIVNTAVTEVSLAGLGTIVNPGDKLFVHLNSVYLVENVDYRIEASDQKIVCLNGSWNSYNIPGCEFAFDLIKKITTIE